MEQKPITEEFINNLCASFEFSVLKTLQEKLRRSILQYPRAKSVQFVGGVSANLYLQSGLSDTCNQYGRSFYTPVSPAYSTDNAAMIASAGFFLQKHSIVIPKLQYIDPNPRLTL